MYKSKRAFECALVNPNEHMIKLSNYGYYEVLKRSRRESANLRE